jgi:hypothetical protein
VLDVVLCLIIVFSFFMPWMQLEMVPIKGIHLNEIALENYGAGHIMAKLIYALYLLPVLAILVISATLFGFRRYLWIAKVLMLILAGVTFYMILQFHRSPDYNIWMRYGTKVSALACVILLAGEIMRFTKRRYRV